VGFHARFDGGEDSVVRGGHGAHYCWVELHIARCRWVGVRAVLCLVLLCLCRIKKLCVESS
jgi:hypothetical protein